MLHDQLLRSVEFNVLTNCLRESVVRNRLVVNFHHAQLVALVLGLLVYVRCHCNHNSRLGFIRALAFVHWSTSELLLVELLLEGEDFLSRLEAINFWHV